VFLLPSRNVRVKFYKIIILPVALFGCETWSITLRKEHRLRVFENRVLRRIFVLNRDEVTREWRKLYNGEIHNFYSSPNIIRQIKSGKVRWAGPVARTGREKKVYRVLWESPEERNHSEDRGVNGRTGSKWILERLTGRVWSGFIWPTE
jgi:hypothetical protein